MGAGPTETQTRGGALALSSFSQAPDLSRGQGLRGRAGSLKLIVRPPGACPVLRMDSLSHPMGSRPACLPRVQMEKSGPRETEGLACCHHAAGELTT